MLTTKRRVRRKISPNVSRQRAWQIKQREQGLCILCSEPAWRRGSCHCPKHREEHNEREKARYQRKINPPPPPGGGAMEPTEKEIAEYEEHEWHDDKYDMRGMKLNVHCPHCWPALRKPATR